MKEYKNHIIQQNYFSFLNQTNNLILYAADSIPIDHQKRKFGPDTIAGLGLPNKINNMYDYQMATGFGYTRLQHLAIISICSDTEFLLKDICENYFKLEKKTKNYYQKLDVVNTEIFLPRNIDLILLDSFNTLKLGFQLRHIFVHNMGFVDEAFNKNTNSNFPVDTQFPLTREIMSKQINAFEQLLADLDEKLNFNYD